ncbi:MAG: hypothetical protein DWQ46_00935 [Planctomycetota bacterium]|nr:MAG: hypothetical protein DWQ46_00935 [Planctomycetota bacterium]
MAEIATERADPLLASPACPGFLATTRPTNPFSSRAVRPGAMPFLCEAGADEPRQQIALDELVDRLARSGNRGQIVGPHGSGKSTLLAALVPRLAERGQEVRAIALHDGQRRLPADFLKPVGEFATVGGLEPDGGATHVLLVVDGYEQLAWRARWRLGRCCRRRGWGLLITAHRDMGLPAIWQTEVSLPLARRLVDRLLAHRSFGVDDAELAHLLTLHRGNMRSVLFDLYDRYERLRGYNQGGEANYLAQTQLRQNQRAI